MSESFYQRHKRGLDRFSGLFLGNTVLGRGLVIAPVVIAANTLKNGVFLGLAFMIITGLTVLFGTFISQKIPYAVRVIIYTVMAAVIYIPTSLVLSPIFSVTMYKVGIFFPLLITNSLIVTRIDSRFRWEKRGDMVIDLICHLLGFLVVIVAVGAFREIFGTGHLWDLPVESVRINTAPALMYPFSGFIIIGFFAAILQKIKNIMMTEREDTENGGNEE